MNSRFCLYSVAITFVLFSVSLSVHASEIKIPGSGTKNSFGQSVSISGDYAIVGIPKDDTCGKDAGLARIFRYTGSTWEESYDLCSPEPVPFAHFGSSVSLSGDYALVGACRGDGAVHNSGAAYVFKRSGSFWANHGTLIANDGKRNDNFGFSVSVSGDTAIVGAYRNDEKGTDAGAAYIFKNNGGIWSQQAKLRAGDAAAWDYFGWSVSVSGDYAIVGAPGRDDNGIDAGAAYIFYNSGSGWSQQSKIMASDGKEVDFFGFSVSISGSCAIAGAHGRDDRGTNSGSAYIFSGSGTNWSQTAKLTAADGGAQSFFGRSVSLSENYAAVGADGTENRAGAVYVFKKNDSSWSQTKKLTANDTAQGDRLGAFVSVSDFVPPDTPVSPVYFHTIAGAGVGADTDGTGEAVYFFGNDSPGSPSILVSPDSLSLSNCYAVGRAAEDQTASPRNMDDETEFGMGLIIPDEVRQYWDSYLSPPKNPGLTNLPTSMDWSQYDTPAKSQGTCSSCSVFATVALVENLANQANFPISPDFSEQALLSCVSAVTCGEGGWYWDILNYIHQSGAIAETCYPYEGNNGNCDSKCKYPDYIAKIGAFTSTPGLWPENHSADDLRLALQNGPLIVSMRVPADGTFIGNGYQGGIYNYNGGEISWSNGHAVLLVGYNDAEQSFKAKNSWGTGWGENGYFRIAYDDVTDDVKFGSYACSASGVYFSEKATVLTISNRGTADLIISSISTSQSWLSISPNSGITVLPNSEKTFIVSVSNWNLIPPDGSAQAQIRIFSNDPQKPSVTVGVTASRPYCPSGPGMGTTGNIDCIGGVDLKDAVLALQVLTGINADGICPNYPESDTDVNNDGRIGMEEVIYILRHLSQ
ncbi:MAG: C1 family peptidase [Desulfobacterales bacterium]